ncbi:beta-lactamase family protein [Nocardia sp. NEAU-G5]|uniref:Beta-lactamase family protein n=1 Tax=Nocardia albiluteola TaxID=2842303 RepID=A0ABS6B007_9NOCA|nr:beta-lactamase family protein [Nocardia albiluteola]MBU3065561.1 beta-lactamase family protein [Nocardia albiluteola]
MWAVAACGGDRAVRPTADPGDAGRAQIVRALDAVTAHGLPGAQVVITGPGVDWTAGSGVGDLGSRAPFPVQSEVRIGSNTKTFVSTVLLQLAAEHKVDLDAPVERYLPGVIRGNGNDGARITIRELLQHSSGLPEYLTPEDPSNPQPPNPAQVQLSPATMRQHHTPREMLANALTMPPQFEPGAKSVYTNTNYLVAGMVIERVTGQSTAAEIDRRIIAPLGLHGTYFPGDGDTGIRDPHPRGYFTVDGKPVDVTEFDTSWAGAAGAMISTGADLNRFFTALLNGKLLPAAQLAQMQRTRPNDRLPGGYGLGLARLPVSCGAQVWGHGGDVPGFETMDGVRADGRAVTVTVNGTPSDEQGYDTVTKAFDTAICAGA